MCHCPQKGQAGRMNNNMEGRKNDTTSNTKHSTTSVPRGMKRVLLLLNHVSVESGTPHSDPIFLYSIFNQGNTRETLCVVSYVTAYTCVAN